MANWAPGPGCPEPNCPPLKSGKLGPGQLGPGAQLSALKKWQIGPRTVGPLGSVCPGPTVRIKKWQIGNLPRTKQLCEGDWWRDLPLLPWGDDHQDDCHGRDGERLLPSGSLNHISIIYSQPYLSRGWICTWLGNVWIAIFAILEIKHCNKLQETWNKLDCFIVISGWEKYHISSDPSSYGVLGWSFPMSFKSYQAKTSHGNQEDFLW